MIYFIQESGKNYIKIGISSNIQERLQSFQTFVPHNLILLHQKNGDRSDEMELHNKFKNDHIRGEWFKPNNILQYIQKEKEKFNRIISRNWNPENYQDIL